MPCGEWSKCVENYQSAVQTYAQAVFSLSVGDGSEFSRSWQLAERARKNSEDARAALLDHEHDHACMLVGVPSGASQIPGVSTEDLKIGDQGQSGG